MTLYERLSAVTLLPWTHNEDLQVLRYDVGEKYDAHEDAGEEGSVSGVELSREGGQRVATVLLYLEEPEEGGETAFPDSEWIDGSRRDDETSWVAVREEARGDETEKGRRAHVLVRAPEREDRSSRHTHRVSGGARHQVDGDGVGARDADRWTATQPRRPPGCDDADERCRGWSNTGECEKNPGFMLAKCPWSCRVTGCEH